MLGSPSWNGGWRNRNGSSRSWSGSWSSSRANRSGRRRGFLGGRWLWVFASKDITIYAIRFSRGGEVPAEMLGEDFDGVLIVDGLASYDVLECVKGRCVAHILRRARSLTETDTLSKSDRDHVENLITLLKTSLDTAARRDEWAESTYSRKTADRTGLRRLAVPQRRPTRRRAAPGQTPAKTPRRAAAVLVRPGHPRHEQPRRTPNPSRSAPAKTGKLPPQNPARAGSRNHRQPDHDLPPTGPSVFNARQNALALSRPARHPHSRVTTIKLRAHQPAW